MLRGTTVWTNGDLVTVVTNSHFITCPNDDLATQCALHN
jgi:hypothetical protein